MGDDARDRDLGVYLRFPRFEDHRVGPVVKQIRDAAALDQGVTLELSRREAADLDSILRLGEDALRIVRELAAETWKLPGMAKLAQRRRDEILAGNYASLLAGGWRGNGRVRLQRPDEHEAGEPYGACFLERDYGRPLVPVEAVEALAEFEGITWSAMLKRLQRARTNLAREPHPDDPQIADLPGNRQDPGQ